MSLIAGARQLPTHHITIRVPWHDKAWNGTVCQAPCANTSCTVLPRIGTGKEEEAEAACAGRSIQGFDEPDLPPCVDEHGTFMASFPVHKLKKHPYQFLETHNHFGPTPFRFDAFAAAAIPFRWMLKENVEGSRYLKTEGLAKAWDLGYDASREPPMDKRVPDTWVQEGTNQRVMLDTFFSAVQPQESLVFFYAKRTPLSDSPHRVIVGVGRVTGVGEPIEYHYEGGKRPRGAISGFLWERSVAHSIRIDGKGKIDGFLLPYHQLLAHAEEDENLELERFVAFAPDEGFEQYSYGSELLYHDNAIASLLAIEAALREIGKVIPGPWIEYRGWVDRELNRLWKLRGPYPGLGAALSAFGVERGNLLAWHLTAQQQEGEGRTSWDLFDDVLKAPESLPRHLQNCVGPTLARKWQQLDVGRKAMLKLLSWFELSNDQAAFWYSSEQRKSHGQFFTDEELRKNAYLMFEADCEFRLPFATMDRGLFGARDLEGQHELPTESRVAESTDPRRVRAIMVDRLEAAAEEGHTVLPEHWMIDRIRSMPIEPACNVDSDLLPLFDDDLGPVVFLIKENGSRYYQLSRYRDTKRCIADEVSQRLAGITKADEFDWLTLVNDAIEGIKDESDWDELERAARAEKAAALRMIFRSRISVLMGAAGTGKSTLIKALCQIPGVKEGGVLLLAPTGKARVRLEQASDMRGQGKTIAQFLNGYQRYDGRLGRYFMNAEAARSAAHRTVVIDECSMLTEDQLAATLDALHGVDRLILVGDPKQLPPIGAGRPYVDICNRLRPADAEQLVPRVAQGYAELLVTRRQQAGDERIDLAFANLFAGGSQSASADEAWNFEVGSGSTYMDVVLWETTEQLNAVLREALANELGLASADDALMFEQSYGGSEHQGKVYFWPRGRGENEGGAAAKAESWQVLSPLRHSMVGADAINRHLQTQYRTFALELSARTGYQRRIPRPMGAGRILWGDKVINVMNKSERDTYPEVPRSYVANGEIGVVTGSFRTKSMKRVFEQLEVEMATQPGVVFKYKEWEFGAEGSPPLELAYALTVHKTQGSEFGKTFIVIPRHCRLLTREMLYTALTRHKEKVVLLVQGQLKNLFAFSLDSASETKRRMTNLFMTSRPIEVQLGHRKVQLDHRLVYRTDRGELVRSKSEWIIADKLHAAGIAYVYEPELLLGGRERWPDFVISDQRRGITWYWEHLGLMDSPVYRDRWEAKRLAYQSEGIVPIEQFVAGKSSGILVTTQEDSKTSDLSEQISAKLALILNPDFG